MSLRQMWILNGSYISSFDCLMPNLVSMSFLRVRFSDELDIVVLEVISLAFVSRVMSLKFRSNWRLWILSAVRIFLECTAIFTVSWTMWLVCFRYLRKVLIPSLTYWSTLLLISLLMRIKLSSNYWTLVYFCLMNF